MELTAQHFMRSDHLVLDDSLTIREIFDVLTKNNISGCILIDQKKEFSGNFNQRDILLSGLPFDELLRKKACAFKSFKLGYSWVYVNDELDKILKALAISQYGIIFVLNEVNYPVGMIQSKNILEKLLKVDSEKKLAQEQLHIYNLQISENVKHITTMEEDYLRFKDIFNNSPDMIHSVDAKGKIIQVNKKECDVLGYSEDELLKMDVNNIYSPDVMLKMINGFEKLKKEGEAVAVETALITKDGKRIDVEVNSTAVYDGNNNFIATRSILRDITERKKMEVTISESIQRLQTTNRELNEQIDEISRIKKELEKSNHELEASNTLKDDLVAMVSHDLKSPISTIIGVSQIAMEDSDLSPDELKNFLNITYRQGSIALSLCNSLLDNYKIDHGAFQLSLENKSLVDIIQLAAEDMKFLASQKGIKLDIQNQNPNLWIYCDVLRMGQVFKNLISNAIKWSPENDSIEIKIESKDKSASVSIIDHGPGITQDRIQEIFDKAKQLKRKNSHGTGFGLSIAKEIIELHGGNLQVTSEPNKRTSFTISFPNVTKK